MLLGVLGVFALVLSGFLVVNTVSALLARQTKQIGIMKAIGAREPQIAAMYLFTVLGFGALSLAVGIPAGSLGARGLAGFLADLCNFDVQSYALDTQVVLAQVAVGLAVPTLAGVWPVLSGIRISVREALASDSMGAGPSGRGIINAVIGRLRVIPRPLVLSIRNTFRRKGRLALTLTTLTLAGAVFIAVLSVHDSSIATMDDALAYFNYDVELRLNSTYRAERLAALAATVAGVAKTEVLAGGTVRRVRPDKTESNNISMLALPAGTPFIRPTLIEGRWLLPDDQNALVVNNLVLKDEPDIRLGGDVTLTIGGKESVWQVVGIVKGVLTGSSVYASQPYYWRLTDNAGRSSVMWIVGDRHDPVSQRELAASVEEAFKAAGMRPSGSQTIAFVRQTAQSQFDIIIVFLMIMAVMLAFVGGLGLMGTMSLNVLDRSREIGVMRAIGASDGQVRLIFVAEAIVIAVISWLIGLALSAPLSKVLSDQVGIAFAQSPFTYRFSLLGALGWLVAVVGLATVASILPARSASRLTVRDVLNME
jgi:putative ABC transport system permease protein